MVNIESKDIIIGIIFLVVGLLLSPFVLRNYEYSEHNLNSTNPLILDYDFVLCKGKYNWFFSISNLSSKNISDDNIDWNRICEDAYQKRIGLEYGWHSYQEIDNFFSGQEEEIITNLSIYALSKIREINNGREILIKIVDKGRGKKYFWEK